MRIIDEDHERRLVHERVVHIAAFHPRVLHERVPIADFVLLTDEALDQLSQEVNQVLFLIFCVVWALHKADLRPYWLNLIDLAELLGKGGPALLCHDVLVDAGDLAHQVNLVQVSAAYQNVSEEVLLFQAHSLAEVDEHHLNDRLPGIQKLKLRLSVHGACEDGQLALVCSEEGRKLIGILQVIDQVSSKSGLATTRLTLDYGHEGPIALIIL